MPLVPFSDDLRDLLRLLCKVISFDSCGLAVFSVSVCVSATSHETRTVHHSTPPQGRSLRSQQLRRIDLGDPGVQRSQESVGLSSWVRHRRTTWGLHRRVATAVVTKSRSNLVPSAPNLLYVSKTSACTASSQRLFFSNSPAPATVPGFDALSLQR